MPGRQNWTTVGRSIAVAVIALGVAAAIGWYIIEGWHKLSDNPNFAYGLLMFTLSVAVAVVVLSAFVQYFFGKQDGEGGPSFLERLIAGLMAMQPIQAATALIGLATVALISWFIVLKSDLISSPETGARGLITFSVAIVTVAIALMMVFYVIFGPVKTDNDASPEDRMNDFTTRFTSGKDVLMVFVGILGTIMGFYYGNTDKVSPKDIQTITGQQNAGNNQYETRAFELLLKQNFDDAKKAFDLASKATPISPNIANINAIMQYLDGHTSDLQSGRPSAWQLLYCDISNNKRAVGQSKELNDKFDTGCKPPVPLTAATPDTSVSPSPSKSPATTTSGIPGASVSPS